MGPGIFRERIKKKEEEENRRTSLTKVKNTSSGKGRTVRRDSSKRILKKVERC